MRETVVMRHANLLSEHGIDDVSQIEGMSLMEASSWPGCGKKALEVMRSFGAVDDIPEKVVAVREPRKCSKCGAVLSGPEFDKLTVQRFGLERIGWDGRPRKTGSCTVLAMPLCGTCSEDAVSMLRQWAGE